MTVPAILLLAKRKSVSFRQPHHTRRTYRCQAVQVKLGHELPIHIMLLMLALDPSPDQDASQSPISESVHPSFRCSRTRPEHASCWP